MCVEGETSTDSFKGTIRLHLCRMGKIARCQTSLYLLRLPAQIGTAMSRRKSLVSLNTKALEVSLELATDAHGTLQSPVIQEIVATPLGILFALGDECLVYIEIGKMVSFLHGELAPVTFGSLLIALMLHPHRALETDHGGDC